MLYQLSYPGKLWCRQLAFEPATSRFSGERSYRLSYIGRKAFSSILSGTAAAPMHSTYIDAVMLASIKMQNNHLFSKA
jgi:hypothetical protein